MLNIKKKIKIPNTNNYNRKKMQKEQKKEQEKFEEGGNFYYKENKEFVEMMKREDKSRLEVAKLKRKIKNLKSDLQMQKKVNAGWYGKDQKYIVEEIQYQNNVFLKNDRELREALKKKTQEYDELKRKYDNLNKFANDKEEISVEVFEKKNHELNSEKEKLEKDKSDYKRRITNYIGNEFEKRELEYKNQILNLELEKKNVDPKKVEKLKKKISDRNFKIELLENEIQSIREEINYMNNEDKECMECHLDGKKRIADLHKLNKMYRENLNEKDEDLLISKNNLEQTRDHLRFMEAQILGFKTEVDSKNKQIKVLKRKNWENKELLDFYKKNNTHIDSYDEKLHSLVQNLEKENESLKNLVDFYKSKNNSNHYDGLTNKTLVKNLQAENEKLKSKQEIFETNKKNVKTLVKENETLKELIDFYRSNKNNEKMQDEGSESENKIRSVTVNNEDRSNNNTGSVRHYTINNRISSYNKKSFLTTHEGSLANRINKNSVNYIGNSRKTAIKLENDFGFGASKDKNVRRERGTYN